jgi:hypothetical protein
VPGAGPRHAARKNFSTFLNEGPKNFGLLVVDVIDLVDAEPTNLLFADKVALAPLRGTARAWPAALRTRPSRPTGARGMSRRRRGA